MRRIAVNYLDIVRVEERRTGVGHLRRPKKLMSLIVRVLQTNRETRMLPDRAEAAENDIHEMATRE